LRSTILPRQLLLNFLLQLIREDNLHKDKFCEARIAQAQRILEIAGPEALSRMTYIAAQMAQLSTAQINGIATNLTIALGDHATA
jgi:hypothetical protein